ncbi:hypothetical protein [Caballeronia sp. ATUFL_M2_KS44]|uniref:hypothetical protein n=1 Tax=Caballeronia sp. ATUFL_M2_KS44 TaxID=2921767 RepID=UPI0020294CB7|nr:hypothetical protein [Caballeronia sp. ATUFL_M2_KS44]
MNYLTIIGVVWTVCAIFAVLFIRGATVQDKKPARAVQIRERAGSNVAGAAKEVSRAS